MIRLCQKEESCNEIKINDSDCNIIEMGWWIDKTKHQFLRNQYMDSGNLANTVKSINNTGVFSTIYRYNSSNIDDAHMIADLYLDFDCKDDFEKVREDVKQALGYLSVVFRIPHDAAWIYFSGNKGMHITIPYQYFSITPSKDLNGVFKYIAENISNYTKHKTLDLAIYDNKRLFRIPNTIHETSRVYKIPLTAEEVRNLSYADILELAKKPRLVQRDKHTNIRFSTARYEEMYSSFLKKMEEAKNHNIKHKATLRVTPPCIKNILEDGAKEGHRNNTIAILSSFYRNRGLDMKAAVEYISKWNNEKNTPPTSQTELYKTVRSIFSGKSNFGCNTIKLITECDETKCPLKKRSK